jgi:uncharacterized membrane protein (DUF2068 family)
MPANRWLDRTQPQTLYIATVLLYINGVFEVIFGGLSLIAVALAAGQIAAGYGIANEKRWGYFLGVVMAFLPFVLQLLFFHNPFATNIITLMFEIALVALLLHRQSREYQRIWFK